jgi:tRNA G18 (ribose-2'-O)-methylase SpoU
MNIKLSMEELNRIDTDQFILASKVPVIIVLDNIRSQNNTGSIFRTADAFRLEGIFLCGITATPPHREIQKTALGSTESVHWRYFQTTLEAICYLQEQGYTLIAVEQTRNSLPLQDFKPEKDRKYALLFGNEVNGVGEAELEKCSLVLEIPQFGTKHSLNVAVSVGIVIWDIISSGEFSDTL